MRTVYIPQMPTRYDKATGTRVPTIDTNPASSYGTLTTLFAAEAPLKGTIDHVRMFGTAIDRDDYLLAVGDIVLLLRIIMDALERNGRVLLLRWNSTNGAYFVEEVLK